nr:immunoglobulin superfamily member 5 isoform X1 [Pogona vitticeps]XP_020644949.1 immunoglobulin superfamily member 5 isoform X1 [Pogona vitticeps]
MERRQEWIGLTLCLFTFLTDPGFTSSIIEGPRNLTVLAGSAAQFNCTVSEGWDVLIWLFNGNPRLTLLSDGKTYISPRYSQKGYSTDGRFTSELTISDVQLNDSGQIKCSIQNEEDDMYAFLTVQVNGSLNIKNSNFTVRKNQTIEVTCEALGWAPAPQISWTGSNILINNSMYITDQSQGLNGLYDEESTLTLTPLANVNVTCLAAIDALSKPQNASATVTVYEPPPIESDNNEDGRIRTIILAVVLPVVGLLLLILIILLIVCCCKRRKESSYQKEVQRNVSERETNRNLEKTGGRGYENNGYSPEEDMSAEKMSGDSTFPKMSSSVYRPKQGLDMSPAPKVPYNRDNEVLPSRTTAYPTKSRQIRNVTHV